ncbi:MAG: MAPEG family protein [Betaproteobacteria bacterium]|nr:MAPEG family protein [Betaproteobacteria bacterium]
MSTAPLAATALYAALLGVLVAVLMLAVIRLRRKLKVGLGDGGHKQLQCAIRAHGNAIETVPIFLILLAVLEANGGKPMFLHICGTVFVLARVLHAAGLSGYAGPSMGRMSGTTVTIVILFVLATANLIKVFG